MLANTFDLFPKRGARASRKVRARYRNLPMTASEFLFDLTRCGLSKLAAAARSEIEYLRSKATPHAMASAACFTPPPRQCTRRPGASVSTGPRSNKLASLSDATSKG